ncbi:MAG: hypothetical protein KDJ99_30680 [Candidatus Competibacteraceae bacterium]|nr:hypothetical protein [Candidatus Competibacteraceae bacterium]
MKQIELAKMITDLRKELTQAQKTRKKEEILFRVQEIELEVQMVSTQEASGMGGVKFWVINADAAGKVASEAIQKLRLKLKPVDDEGGDIDIAGEGSKPK